MSCKSGYIFDAEDIEVLVVHLMEEPRPKPEKNNPGGGGGLVRDL